MKLKESKVIFSEDPHTYTLGEKQLSGITSIVKWFFPETYKNVPEDVLKEAAKYGSMVHKKCEQFDICGFGDDLKEVQDYARLKKENNLTTLTNEYLVDDGKNFASSIDVVFNDGSNVFDLADIKTTSQIHVNNVTLQLSIYAYLFEKCNRGKKVGKLFVIWLPKEQYGDAKLMQLERISTTDCKRIMKAYLNNEEPTELRKEIFKETELAMLEEDLPANLKDVENEIIKLETNLKELEDKRNRLKDGLLALMITHNVKKWQGEHLQLVRKLDTEREALDTEKVKKEHPEIYKSCMKVSKVKGSLTIKII